MRDLTKSLKPRGNVFFDRFESSAQNMVTAADLLEEMLGDFPARGDLAQEILECEHEGDRITHDLERLLNTTFVTPMDRNDILELTSSIDDVVDFTEEVADFLGLYQVPAVRPDARQLAAVLAAACRQLALAIVGLRSVADVSEHVVEVHRLENEGDRIFRAAVAALFSSGADTLDIVRWKDVLERLENAVDATERAASIIEGVVLKGS